ncbi:sigma-70 family RNA polymerase sigma factor [Rhodopirellula sp. MGV]|uniref:sigma-70 family RNA polymerase sigma factor n=1 Tax=Rhodopirellula sp. MGV TaxID=2023130 RepID=UPI000B96706A|nr:sigma-70 family RNA polymerase sigma factor [Rhodopirellula sp. MGV]OYP36509.1 hypothetical protein CGZ80_08260 [Rhodopirellula sp. MGV]PNY37850.1 hypothetical protein C2E31_04910 [Rhodopirellula baltica]
MNEEAPNTGDDYENALRKSWSIGPLRPWLRLLAERQLPRGLKGRIDPSDVVQQTLVDAWRGNADFRGTTQAERLAWLKTILQRTLMRFNRDQLQTQKRGLGREQLLQAAIDQDSLRLSEMAIDRNPGPADIAEQSEKALRLAAALNALQPADREVLVLRHLENLTHEEIAKRIGKSNAAARMMWIRGLEKLRVAYEETSDETTG